jgi:ABC-type branched-subunit amino acid transport system substrate-binding protein
MGIAGAQTSSTSAKPSGKKTLAVIGAYEKAGESRFAQPNFDDGAKLAVTDLERDGWTVQYQRIPASVLLASATEAAFAAAVAAKPDFFLGLASNATFLPLGAKVAATDQPTLALSSPAEGVRTGVAGGDNLYLLRPLDAQLYRALAEYACGTLRLQRLGLSIVEGSFGTQAQRAVEQALEDHPKCKVVTVQTNPPNAVFLNAQVKAFQDAGVDGIIAANSAGPVAAQVNLLREAGVTVPILGDSSLHRAKTSNAITTDLENLVVVEDCVPSLTKSKAARKFTEDYKTTYGYAPDDDSAQTYDAFHIAANAVERARSHDAAKINQAMKTARYRGVCDYAIDKNNVLGRTATIYGYHADGSKRRIEQVRVTPVDVAQLTTPS